MRSSIEVVTLLAATVGGAGAVLFLFAASRAMRRGDRQAAQVNGTLAVLGLMIGGGALLLARLMLP